MCFFVCELESWTFKNAWTLKYDLCAFDLRSPLISADDIHEWIYTQMCLNDQEVTMVQIDGRK